MSEDIASNAQRLLRTQLLAAVIAGLLFLAQGQWAALSALYGAFISLSTTLLLSRGMHHAERLAGEDLKKMQAILYGGAAVRFVLVIALFLLGLAVLALDPLATAAGFGLAHAAHLINLRALKPGQHR